MDKPIAAPMMMTHIRLAAAAVAAACTMAAHASAPDSTQCCPSGGTDDDARLRTELSADIVSRYIWRGQDLGAVSLQPTLGVAWRGLSLTAWGNVGLSQPQDDEEIDLTLAYEHGRLHVAVTDYWFAYSERSILDGLAADPSNRYFHYAAHDTNHLFEANVGYDFGLLTLDWFTNFAGCDGINGSGRRAYSSYIQVEVPFRLAACDWTATVGAVPWATDFYDSAHGLAVTDITLRAEHTLRLSRHMELPLFAALSANPSTQRAYLSFGLTLRP